MKSLRIISIVLLFFVAINALVAGFLFMLEPNGHLLGVTPELLKFTSFKNFFVPGLILFTVNGLFALFTAFAMLRFWPFCAFWLCCQGLLLCGWIILQLLMLRNFSFLHLLLGSIGLFFVFSGILLLRQPDSPNKIQRN